MPLGQEDTLSQRRKPYEILHQSIIVESIFIPSSGELNIPFVLGHALYMKAVHGGKAKNDKIDSHKIATLLRGGLIRVR